MTESEARRDAEDTGDKIKAGAKALGKKVEDPDKDLNTKYEKEKFKENFIFPPFSSNKTMNVLLVLFYPSALKFAKYIFP